MSQEKPLTDLEIKEIRKNLESDARVKWLWSSARVWVVWFSGAIIGAYALQDAIGNLIKKFFGPV